MQRQLGRYVGKMFNRMALCALAALTGVMMAGIAIGVPIVLLYELGIIEYRLENHNQAWWASAIVGAFWGIAHTMETILKVEKVEKLAPQGQPARILQMTTYRETYRGYGIFSLNDGEFEVSGPDGARILATPSLALAKQTVDEIEGADNPKT
jgi:hypothetical protein